MRVALLELKPRSVGMNALALVLAIGVVCASSRSGQARDDSMDKARAESGGVWYEKYCTPCHGPGGAPGDAVYRQSKKPVDLRRYVARHGGRFPAGDWLLIITGDVPSSVHTDVWKKIRDDQGGTAPARHGDVFSKKVVAHERIRHIAQRGHRQHVTQISPTEERHPR